MIAALFAAGFALPGAKAQSVNGLRLSELRAEYIEIKSYKRVFSDDVLITLEYGQLVRSIDDLVIKDDLGKRMFFNSAIDFVNKMKSYGYALFQGYSEQDGKDTGRSVYVLKRI